MLTSTPKDGSQAVYIHFLSFLKGFNTQYPEMINHRKLSNKQTSIIHKKKPMRKRNEASDRKKYPQQKFRHMLVMFGNHQRQGSKPKQGNNHKKKRERDNVSQKKKQKTKNKNTKQHRVVNPHLCLVCGLI